MLGRRNLPHDHGRLRTVRPSEKTVSSNQTALSDGLIRKTAPNKKPSLQPRIAEAHTRSQPDIQNPYRRQKTILKPPRSPAARRMAANCFSDGLPHTLCG
ncbi:hypothetical protein [Neisseria elongata]|uniref:hypothetical protein n=1 Tax=Neisseria elongata TaxID=495 RepID=UPI0006655B89|nr:hypothetical protein [Neisseria elongata]